ncbi:MAG: sugar nucleotide-binding protein [Flavobacteriales bacterium]|jgi:dTDP-4-dehydrorhamnose reductase|uniref:sugar nucleotide-binding protein n=1 Tax=Candidatus Ulvibacter alkanivorans TaxID=2267620 RepID=UPI000DF367CA|nr:sugar nucleotide-binding protein [Candidatus Ulvibacter alkanivorans]MCH2489123.1 sugar nucleotide-binding protein [Flavobacteriales bacterium]
MRKKESNKNTILILGASGFIGNVLYKELLSYFDVYGTYCQNTDFKDNQVFYQYDVTNDDLYSILEDVRPNYIISALRGDFQAQLKAHETALAYVMTNEMCKLLFLSSVNVFDGRFRFPSFEKDLPIAESEYGKFKLSVEKMFVEIPSEKYAILRLPMVLGVTSPRIIQLQQAIKHKASFEVYPNLIISVTTVDKIAQQLHYIINQDLSGIFHLSSDDMVHHEDFFKEITAKLGDHTPIFKNAYRSNDDNYLAILPKQNKLPQPYRISVAEVIEDCTLKEEISTFKN